MHAVLGCDTTSRLFGIGKGAILKKIRVNAALKQAADVFDKISATTNVASFGGNLQWKEE